MPKGVSYDVVRDLGLTLPGVEESTSYGTPALKVAGKLLVRLREDGDSIVAKVGFDHRELFLHADPEVFFTTDHYQGYPTVLVRLAEVDRDTLRDVLEVAWRNAAPKRLLAQLPP